MCAAMSQAAAVMQALRQQSSEHGEQEKLLPLFNDFLNSPHWVKGLELTQCKTTCLLPSGQN